MRWWLLRTTFLILVGWASPVATRVILATASWTPPPTQPFAPGASGGGTFPLGAATTPGALPLTCKEGDLRRCNGNTVQDCNISTHLWENFQACDAFGERCSSALSDCFGLLNWACCVTR